MQVKKFEAPTIQEALEHIKRELGPEAIILQTKKNKRGFGLMSKASVEVTAAVSDRSMQKKKFVDSRVPDETRANVDEMGAERQAEFIDGYVDRHLEQAAAKTRDRVQMSGNSKTPPPMRNTVLAAAARDAAATRANQSRRITEVATHAVIGRPGTAGAIAAGAPSYGPTATSRSLPARPNSALNASGATAAKITQSRYIDIDAHELMSDSDEAAPSIRSTPPGSRFAAAITVPATLSMEEELQHLKRMMNEMQATQEGVRTESQTTLATPALQDAFEQLVLNGVDRRYAHSLIKQAGFALGMDASANPDEVLDQVATEILGNITVSAPINDLKPRAKDPETGIAKGEGPHVFALVGPTGVGKTTTVAKLASQAAIKRGLRVGLISLDLSKSLAFDALQSYAKILNAPYRTAKNPDELQAAIRDFHTLDVVFIDTAGRAQRDPSGARETQEMLGAVAAITGRPTETHLVLAATARDSEHYEWIHRFSSTGVTRPTGIIVTKLDEATIYGGLYNVSQRSKLPLLYFTTGQKVPEDVEPASGERLVALVMDL